MLLWKIYIPLPCCRPLDRPDVEHDGRFRPPTDPIRHQSPLSAYRPYWSEQASHWSEQASHWSEQASHWSEPASHWAEQASHWSEQASHWSVTARGQN